MRWIIVLLLIGFVYWLFASGYVNLDASLQYITTAIRDVIESIVTAFKSLQQ